MLTWKYENKILYSDIGCYQIKPRVVRDRSAEGDHSGIIGKTTYELIIIHQLVPNMSFSFNSVHEALEAAEEAHIQVHGSIEERVKLLERKVNAGN